jgi:hypothetical protein
VNWNVYRDKKGALWLDPGDEDGALLALDAQGAVVLRAEHGACDRATVEDKFGPLRELTDPRDLLPAGERWPLLTVPYGRTEAEAVAAALRLAGRAAGADDCRGLLEACGLLAYQKGSPA